jgi:circadian clock protein KaiC
MHDSDDELGRAPTGVPGLDTILAGGLLPRSTAIIQGAPGSGKTVLANQIAFHLASRGTRVLYVTLLAETHAALLRHLGSLAFFNPSLVGDAVVYLSGVQALRENALLPLLQKELIARRPGVLVLDGLSSVLEVHGGGALRQFLHELQTTTEAANCLSLLISGHAESPSPEDAVVHTVIFLCEAIVGRRTVRELRVNKSRGSTHIHGRHTFLIDDRGVTVFPRIEALYRSPTRPIERPAARVRFDHQALDDMLGGGIPAGSATLLLGATGTGKTLLGLAFLDAGLRRGERVMYAGLYESPAPLVASGESIGLKLDQHVESGLLHVDWQPPVELSLDVWGHRVLDAVQRHRPTRLFLDGFSALQESAAYPHRLGAFMTAVMNELRAQNVTTLLSAELHPIIGAGMDVPVPGVSPMVENTILLRYVELRSHLYRLITVLKVRGSAHERSMREFRIDASGLHVASTFDSAEAILSGSARSRNDTNRDDRDAE